MAAHATNSHSFVDTLHDSAAYDLQKTIFASSILTGAVRPFEESEVLYFADCTPSYVDKLYDQKTPQQKSAIKGPFQLTYGGISAKGALYQMETSPDYKALQEHYLFDLLIKQFRIVESRAKSLSKRNPKLAALLNLLKRKKGKDAFLPTFEHYEKHLHMLKHVNPEMIPAKYVVVCSIEISPLSIEVETSYHFVRWYSVPYVKTNVDNLCGDINKIFSFVMQDDEDNKYIFPDFVEEMSNAREGESDDDLPDLIDI